MSNGDWASAANRVGVWASIVALGIYVYDIGTWVGAADEKFENAKTVEQKQDQIAENVTIIQGKVERNAKDVQEIKDTLKEVQAQQNASARKLDAILRKLEEVD